jgi:ankyrin repeat protein
MAIEILLERNDIKIDAVDSNRITALHWAARNGHTAIVKLLVMHGAHFHTTPKNIRSASRRRGPLHDAASGGHQGVLRIFIDRNVDVQARDESNATALHYAASNGKDETVCLLLGSGVNVNTAADHQSTALHWAAFGGHVSTIFLLLDSGANPDAEIICNNQAK